ncbi:sensor histidine kinase [Sphingomonas sp. GCM10030256]|uniref:sensor histidine kinase n=1 Tax=Sphingomonas sp. GCM10030256 TaxID=3273427 RepID=UPI0036071B13
MKSSRLAAPGALYLALAGYALLFALLHELSAAWSTSLYYSLWFPPAGLRFALLWYAGARHAPKLAAVETIVVLLITGLRYGSLDQQLLYVLSIAGPPLGYGLAIFLASWLLRRGSSEQGPDMRLGLAVLIAPIFGALCSLPPHYLLDRGDESSLTALVGTASIFVLGDLLGVLILAPPLLYLAKAIERRAWPSLGSPKQWAESIIVGSVGLLAVWALNFAGYGISLEPLLIAVGWIGLRQGRLASWFAIVAVAVTMLPLTVHDPTDPQRIGDHLLLGAIAAMGYLAGVYSDASRELRRDLRVKDRTIRQAERLKSLQAMSLAVIHELTQPLSTLKIETNYLSRIASTPSAKEGEIKDLAQLIARKATNISDLLDRLRGYGQPSSDQAEFVSLDDLLRQVIDIVAPEARAAAARLEFRFEEGLQLKGSPIELQQALINLLRNAIAASPGSTIRVEGKQSNRMVEIAVINEYKPGQSSAAGMGMGRPIVEAIAELHGGRFEERKSNPGTWEAALILPDAMQPTA